VFVTLSPNLFAFRFPVLDFPFLQRALSLPILAVRAVVMLESVIVAVGAKNVLPGVFY
jgi:hypothetical protein